MQPHHHVSAASVQQATDPGSKSINPTSSPPARDMLQVDFTYVIILSFSADMLILLELTV